MIRRFWALALVSMLFSGMANALGLGEATVKSSLNQPLNANIELMGVGKLGTDEILPGLASRKEFLKAGVERVYFLSNLRFKIIKNSAGKMIIHVTSKRIVREPFLNFLIEVIWPSGRLLREYALLIDPPNYSNEKPNLVVPAITTRPVVTQKAVSSAQVRPVTVAESATSLSTISSTARTYGPTRRDDTLWGIALKIRPDRSVSPQQTMLAIQDLNPGAFIGGNINRLKSGQVLRKPNLEQIRTRTKREAIQQVITQNRQLKNRKPVTKVVNATRKASTLRNTPAPVVKGSELKLVVQSPKTRSETAQGSNAGSGQSEASTSEKSASASNQLDIVSEQLDKYKRANRDLNGRVKDLEQQLNTLQRLMTLKNDQLASIQAAEQKARKKTESASSAQPAPVGVKATTSGSSTTLPPAVLGSNKVVKPQPKIGVTVPKGEKGAVVVPAPKLITPVQKAPQKRSLQLDDYVNLVLNNPVYLTIAAVVIVLVLLFLLLLSKKSAQKEKDFQSQLLNESADDENIDLGLTEQSLQNLDSSEDDIDEFSDNVKAETSDVISEAEIYIAYQRLDRAAQILEEGVSSEPGRSDIRLKLLEVYKMAGNAHAFETQFQELVAMDDDYALQQAKKLREGWTLDDDPEITIDELESQLLSSEDVNVTQLDDTEVDHAEAGYPEEKNEEVESEDSDLAFNDEFEAKLDLDDSELVKDDLADGLDIDFDLDDFEIDTSEEDSIAKEYEPSNTIDFESVSEGDENSLEPKDEFNLADDSDSPSSLGSEEKDDLDFSTLDLGDDTELEQSLNELAEDVTDDNDQDFDLNIEDLDLSELDSSGDLDLEGSITIDSDEQEQEQSTETSTENSLLDEVKPDFSPDDFDLDLDEDMASVLEQVSGEDVDLADAEALIESLGEADANTDESPLDPDDKKDTLPLEDHESSEDSQEEDVSGSNPFDDSLLDEALKEASNDSFIEEDKANEGELTHELEDIGDVSSEQESFSESELSVSGIEEKNEEDFDFLNETDEAGTKLDLARAYLDMGDAEGAQEILEEVLLEGNDQQKEDAKSLLVLIG